jgi:hypothetical protein
MNGSRILLAVSKIILITSLAWMVGFSLALGSGLLQDKDLILAVNIFELAAGLASGAVVLMRIKSTRHRYVILGTALSLLSWALGQVYWFSYASITGDNLPYPSVGDLGFTGTYVFLIGVAGLILHDQPGMGGQPVMGSQPVMGGQPDTGSQPVMGGQPVMGSQPVIGSEPVMGAHANTSGRPYRYAAFLILLIPLFLSLFGNGKTEALIYNYIFGTAVALTLFKASPMLRIRNHRWFAAGIFLLGFTDVLFMTVVSLLPARYGFASDSLYPVSLSLISFGLLKGDIAADADDDTGGNSIPTDILKDGPADDDDNARRGDSLPSSVMKGDGAE